MLKCPNCQVEVKPEERFCGNCGARLTPANPPSDPAQPPARPLGKETVILSPADYGAAPPLENPSRPSTDATIVSGQLPSAPPNPVGSYSTPPTIPSNQPGQPTTPPIGQMYPNASLPNTFGAPPQAQKSGTNIWKILAIITGIGVLACVALMVSGYLFLRRSINVPGNLAGTETQNVFATVNAGLSTAAADPTLQAISSLPTSLALPTDAEPTPAAGGGAVLYKQTFDQPGSDFDADETDNAIYKFVDGTYSVTAKKPNLIVWQKIKGDYGNAAISLDATINGPKDSAAGLIFHYQDDKNFYLFTITGDGRYGLDMYKDDNLTTLIDWTESSAIKPAGEANALRVETVGDKIRLYANDELLDEISDGTFRRGKTAIVVNTFEDSKLNVIFDNLVVRSLK